MRKWINARELNANFISVKSYKPPLSIQPANSTVQKPSDLSCLIPYIKSGRALRNEHSVMYNTPHKMKDAAESIVKSETTVRNLSSIRQHLFGRDSFAAHDSNIDISEESIDLTGNAPKMNCKSDKNRDHTFKIVSAVLGKITVLSTSANATFSFCRSSTVQNVSPETTSKDTVSNMVKKLSETVRLEAEGSCSNKSAMTKKSGEFTISSGGDASLVMGVSQKVNSVRLSKSKIKKSTPQNNARHNKSIEESS